MTAPLNPLHAAVAAAASDRIRRLHAIGRHRGERQEERGAVQVAARHRGAS